MEMQNDARSIILQIIQQKIDLDIEFFLIILVLLILLFLTAIASGTEGALFSINSGEKENLIKSKNYIDKQIVKLLAYPKKLLATILISNNLINITLVILFTLTIHKYFELSSSKLLAFITEVVIITLVLVIIGELVPKLISTQRSLAFARFVAFPVAFLVKIFNPISYLLIQGTKLIDRRLKKRNITLSASEIKQAIDLTINKTQLAEDKNILKRIVTFGNVSVKQIMTPRMSVIAFDKEIGFSKLIEEVRINKFSRVPVFQENLDNIIGILYIKDLLPHSAKDDLFEWNKLIRKPYFVPETKKIDDLLKEFQFKKVHMAVVIDEFGGFSGIVTLEDVLEEIVGEITDEFDDPEISAVKKIDEKTYIINASITLTDLIKALNIPEDSFESVSGDVETLAGLVVEILGKIPDKGQTLLYNNFEIVVESADEKKVHEVKLIILSSEPNKN